MFVAAVISLAIIFYQHISPLRISPPVDKPIKKALRIQISLGLIEYTIPIEFRVAIVPKSIIKIKTGDRKEDQACDVTS